MKSEQCQFSFDFIDSSQQIICPKCLKSTMEIHRLNTTQFIYLCSEKRIISNKLDNSNSQNTEICLYPLDSPDCEKFIGLEGQSAESLFLDVKSYCEELINHTNNTTTEHKNSYNKNVGNSEMNFHKNSYLNENLDEMSI